MNTLSLQECKDKIRLNRYISQRISPERFSELSESCNAMKTIYDNRIHELYEEIDSLPF